MGYLQERTYARRKNFAAIRGSKHILRCSKVVAARAIV
jgi:hypothetical protein